MLVRGGPANSGTKRGKRPALVEWTCERGHANPRYATRCLEAGCNVKRAS